MKITTTKWGRPLHTINLWLIPTLAYIWQKSLGVIRPDREWIWWVGLPIVFSIWMIFNFKIIKK